MHTNSSPKMHIPSYMRALNGVEVLCDENYCGLILSLARASCRLSLPPAQLLSRTNQIPNAVRSRNPSKSTLPHDSVAAAVSRKHHLIICVDEGLIQIVYKSHSRLATEPTLDKVLIFLVFVGFFFGGVR